MQGVSKLLQRIEKGLSVLGRRSEPRYYAQGLAHVYDKAGGSLLGVARLRNISASGVCISMGRRLSPGDRVHLSGPGLGIDVVVRHCAAGSSGYVIGLEAIDSGALAPNCLSGLPAIW